MYQKSVKERAFVVALTDVTKNFGPVRALNGVSVSLQQGDCLGLVGHNGAGKSTLVNVMNGMLEPSSGEVSFPSGRKGVRSIFQELSLCPNLTVAENLRISNPKLKGFYWRHAARIEIRASLDKIFPGHGINPDTVVDELSIAQRQMVEIAIGFARRDSEPKLVILDEPTSSLDATIASQLLMYVREFCSNGGAVIFISHMMDEIFDVTSRIVVLKDGKSVVEGLTKDFTRQSLVDAMGHVASGETGRGATQKDLGAVVVSAEGLEAGKVRSWGFPVWRDMDRLQLWQNYIFRAPLTGAQAHRKTPRSWQEIVRAMGFCLCGRFCATPPFLCSNATVNTVALTRTRRPV